MNNRPQLAGTSNHGFTLLEILLVLVLLLLLFGAAVFEFNSMGRGASLSGGADRLESLFRFARSEAERTGRKIRIRFSAADELTQSTATGPVAEWEADPLEQPGQFTQLPNSVHFTQGVDNLVIVESVDLTDMDSRLAAQLTGDAALPDSAAVTGFELNEPPAIYFYPDGSCDSVKVRLADRNPDNSNKALVELIGLTGTVHRDIIEITPNEPIGGETNEVARTILPLGQPQPKP
ncbi:MAG: GspH/FimT family pseudopilin [Verrucomicrobiota bacterium]|jgi:prepilin-type N-terminal cleavage/methylation domain-containing protein|nr:GspH/FimT family pseudopilin [Verrucomicrobiota bacterium]